jgi:hypothetical protein
VNDLTQAKRLPIDVREALKAICTTGKGRCWHCDAKLPKGRRAIREGWDVQRIDDYSMASIILVCPACLKGQSQDADRAGEAEQKPLPSAAVLLPREARTTTTPPIALRPTPGSTAHPVAVKFAGDI